MEKQIYRPAVVLCSSDESVLTVVIPLLEQFQVDVRIADQADDGYGHLRSSPPDMAIVDMGLTGSASLLDDILAGHPGIRTMLLCDHSEWQRHRKERKYQVAEFIEKPVDPDDFEIAFHRMDEFAKISRERDAAVQRQGVHEDETVDNRIENERFVTVRQMIDRMSLMIGRLAEDVQGGIRYFAEMPNFVSIHSNTGRILAINETYKKYAGNKLDGFSWEIYTGGHASEATCPVGRTIASGNVETTHAVVRYASGAEVPVLVHTSPIYNNDGEVALILEVFAGTKEIDQLSAEIADTHQRYQQLFDEVPCYIVAVDRNLNVAAANRLFKERFGDPAGSTFYSIFDHISIPYGSCSITSTIDDGLPHQGEMVLITREGTQHNMLTWTKPVSTRSGKLIQVLVIFIEVTELHHIQENLTSLGLMLGTLSHNLKNILTGLDAGLYDIEKGFYQDLPAIIEEGLDVSKLMAERIRRLVYDILHYARERELQLTRRPVAEFARDLAASLERRIKAADISFRQVIPADSGEFNIDPALLRSALANVLENAIEACIDDTAKPSHTIAFRVQQETSWVVFDIADNAGGMEKEQSRKMFTLFYSSKGHKGTGLGLFITDQVIRKHGGRISVDTEPGKGTRFRIRLPLYRAPNGQS